jgi:hypothetical protein
MLILKIKALYIFDAFDTDNNGVISFNEFLVIIIFIY